MMPSVERIGVNSHWDGKGKPNRDGSQGSCSRLPRHLAPASKQPRQESNLILNLRRVVCDPPHSEDKNIPARIRTGVETLEESCVAQLHHQDIQEPTAGY